MTQELPIFFNRFIEFIIIYVALFFFLLVMGLFLECMEAKN